MTLPIVAIVGRPNVGKSSLFNRFVGFRKAIVSDTAGVTRDRNYSEILWYGKRFILVDTGGFEKKPEHESVALIREQTKLAIEEADKVIVVCDGRLGLNVNDYEIINLLRKAGKNFYLAVNKLDNLGDFPEPEFYKFGKDNIFPTSAEHKMGADDLMEAVLADIPVTEEDEDEIPEEAFEEVIEEVLDEVIDDEDLSEEEEEPLEQEEEDENIIPITDISYVAKDYRKERLKLAIIGRPNVGKSSFVNQVLGQERAIVSPISGTTMDPVDTDFEVQGNKYTIVDTAGIKRKGKISTKLDKFSVMMAIRAVEKCDLAILLIDAEEGVTDQDVHIAGMAYENGCGMIIILNKWDLLPNKDTNTLDQHVEKVREKFKFIPYAPVISVSAKSGQRVHKVFDLLEDVYRDLNIKVRTNGLNRYVKKITEEREPPFVMRNKRAKFYYVVQTGKSPVSITFFTNTTSKLHFSYERFLSNRICEAIGLEKAPLILRFRARKH